MDPDAYDKRADPSWAATVLAKTAEVFGLVGPTPRIHRGWAGLYPGTPDRHPIIDRVADGVFVALGFAGTGLMQAPAAGILTAELVIEGAMRSVAGALLSASRFDKGAEGTERTGF